MATTLTGQETQEHLREEKTFAEVIFGGAIGEGLLAAATAVLAIIALTGRMAEILLPVGLIVLGASLVFEGAAVTARLYNMLNENTRNRFNFSELGIGTTVESIIGIFAIVLGILALLQIQPLVLVPAAIVAIGACLILEAASNARINALPVPVEKKQEHPFIDFVTNQTIWAATEIQILVGMAGITLGILALCGIQPLTLSLAALLIISAAALISGMAMSGKMLKKVKT